MKTKYYLFVSILYKMCVNILIYLLNLATINILPIYATNKIDERIEIVD